MEAEVPPLVSLDEPSLRRLRGVGRRERGRGAWTIGRACRFVLARLGRRKLTPQAGQFASVFFPLCGERLSLGGQPLRFLTQTSQLRNLLPEPFDFCAEACVGNMLKHDWYGSSRNQRGSESDLDFH